MLSDNELCTAGLKEYKDYNLNNLNYYGIGIELNSVPYHSNVAILVTSFHEHLVFLKSTLENYRRTGKFVICAYDNPQLPIRKQTLNIDKYPSLDIFLLPHSWVFKHITHDASKRNGWFWDIKYGFGILDQFEFDYVFTVNGDCIWERPEGVDEIIELLGDGDLISSSSMENGPTHTCSVLYKIDALRDIIKYMSKLMKVPVFGSRSPEEMLTSAIRYLGLKEVYCPEQPLYPGGKIDHYNSLKQDCTWKKILGYRNLGAERVNWYKYNSGDRPPVEYTDLRFASFYEKKYAKEKEEI